MFFELFYQGSFVTSQHLSETIILVVDDDAQVLDALRRVLEAQQYRVICASNPEEAQKLLAENSPDLILSDMAMPGEDGLSFYERVRRETSLSDVPFIFLTALDCEERRLRATRSGADEYLIKPVEPDTLLAVVEGKLQRSKQLKEISTQKMQALHKRIIHTLSHEFRTPLVSIHAGAELLIEKVAEQDDPTSKLILEAILTGGRRLQRLVDDFMLLQQLDVSDSVTSSMHSSSVVGLSRAVEDTIEMFVAQRRLNEKRPVVQFSIVGSEDVDDLSVPGDYLSDIILRLLENAFKFGGIEQPVDVKVMLSSPYAEVIIRDYGPGFLQEPNAGRVCEPFMQIKREVYEQQGCGVGLTIAQFLAKVNGCEIRFSTPKEGTGVAAHILVPVTEKPSSFHSLPAL